MKHEPDLGIEDPYELNDEQFDAAIDLLKEQRANIGEYWSRRAQADLGVRRRGHGRRHDLAVPGRRPPGGQEARRGACCPRRARPAGPTPG